MYLAKEAAKECCTCNHWKGLRIREGDGLIYSLENIEGACVAATPAERDTNRNFRGPSHCDCRSWEKWSELLCESPHENIAG